MRLGALVPITLLATGCTSEPHLALPTVDGAVAWVIVASTPSSVRAEVVEPSGAVHFDLEGRTIEALAFTEPLGVPPGPLAPLTVGDPLPTPAGVFAADLDALSWSEALPSPAALDLRLPRGDDDCPRLAARSARLTNEEPAGVHALVRLDDDTRLAITPSQWFIITATDVRPIAPILPGVHAIAREPSVPTGGDFVLARGGELWAVQGRDLTTATATRARVLPDGLAPFSLAAPALGVVYGLTTDGRLFRSDTSTAVVVHVFRANVAGTRGIVVTDGTGILAGLGPDQFLVSIDENGVKRTVELPSSSDGVVSIARFAELGLVIGTNNGNLLAERLGYQPVPDPLGQMPRGGPIRMLRQVGDRLLFGGNSGVFGEITARRFICTSALPASSSIRVIEALGDQILVAGLPIQAESGELFLTRYTAQP